MTKAILVHSYGGPEQLKWEDIDVPSPGPGEVRLRQTAVGLNYIDIYFRTGLYKAPSLPFVPGQEGVGIIEALGDGVTDFSIGERVAYGIAPMGAYAETRLVPADRLVKVPDSIDDKTAAAMMLQGLTAQYLLRSTYRVQAGDTVLFHAAAGGVGLIACQWAKSLGATVIGTVGTEEKAELARAHGCDHTILYKTEDVAERVRAITGGEGVPVVYDSVGKDMLMASLDSLRPRGLLVSFGNASGPVTGFDVGVLAAKGSLYLTRPTLATYAAKRDDLVAGAKELFDVVESGKVKIVVNQTRPLHEAAEAQRDLEGRKTTGSTVLTVEKH